LRPKEIESEETSGGCAAIENRESKGVLEERKVYRLVRSEVVKGKEKGCQGAAFPQKKKKKRMPGGVHGWELGRKKRGGREKC
jgi:hypothetical protein